MNPIRTTNREVARIIRTFIQRVVTMLGLALLLLANTGWSGSLTGEERHWLDSHTEQLVLWYNTEFPPIEFADDNNQFIGLGADVISRVEQILGVRFIKQPCPDWNKHLAALQTGECAIAPTIVRTPERESFAFFTTPYSSAPVVMITSSTVPGRVRLEQLTDWKVAVVSGYATENYLRDRALISSFEIIPVNSVAKGLRSVSFGETDAFVENLAVAAYFIDQEGISNLRVAGTTDLSFDWSIGVSRQYPMLYSSIQKALDSIPENDLTELRQKWIALEIDPGLTPETLRLLQLAGGFLVVLLVCLVGITVFLKSRLRRSVRELELSETRYRRLAENSPAVVYQFLMTPDGTFSFPYISETVEKVTGVRPEEVLADAGALLNRISSANRQSAIQKMTCSAQTLQPYHDVFPHDKDGQIIWLEARSTPERLEDGSILWDGFFLDVTDRITAEESLRKSERRFRQIFEGSRDGFVMVNLNGQIMEANQAYCDILGYTFEELAALEDFYRITPERWHDWEEKEIWQNRLLKCGYSGLYEKEYIRKDGTIFPVELQSYAVHGKNGEIEYLWGIARDITNRKRSEQALQENSRFLTDLIERSGTLIYVKNRDGEYQLVNRKWEETTGLNRTEVLGKTDLQIFPETTARAFMDNDHTVMDTGRVVELEEYLESDQDLQSFLSVKFPLYDSSGKIVGVCGMTSDITELKQNEEERIRLQEQLNQARKIESVGRLAGGIAHDFNNMLGVILGHAELAMVELDSVQAVNAHLEEIRKAADRSAELTSQLLAFARKQTIAPQVLDLNATIASTLKMLRRLIGEDIELAWMPGPSLPSVKMDPSQLNQILANLCVNARDAIAHQGGRIAIQTSRVVLDKQYCADNTGFLPGEYVLLEISDNGEGMPAETLPQVFEPFFTTKELGKGTGLGLATVYGVVRQNGGFINVYSEVGRGTTFRIYLPAEHSGTKITEPAKPRTFDLHGTETILLVEDEPAILSLGEKMLTQMGYTVLAATAPGEALRLAELHLDQINLLVTDVVMPGMNGRELTRCVSNLYPGIKCLFMSGYTADVIAHQGVLEDGFNFIQKPFSYEQLGSKVREVLDLPT